MAKKNANPYNEGSLYNIGFGFIRENQIVTRSQVVQFLVERIAAVRSDTSDVPADKKDKYTLNTYKGSEAVLRAAEATATVLLSPRAEGSGKGDCRGNASAKGGKYFMEVLNKVAGAEKRFRLRWRKVELDQKSYSKTPIVEVKQEKTAKAKTKKAKTVKKTESVTA